MPSAVFHFLRYSRSTKSNKLYDVLGKEEIEGPVHSDPQLLFEAGQLTQVNGAPQPPSDEAGKVHAQDVGHTGTPPDCGQLPGSREAKWLQLPAVHRGQ